MGLEERVAASMREAYGKFCGDDIVPGIRPRPKESGHTEMLRKSRDRYSPRHDTEGL